MFGELLKGVLGPIVDGFLKFIPDKNAREAAKEELEDKMLTAMTSLVHGQLAINQKEAEHGSIFVAGWRPFIGWTCGFGIAWQFVVQPLLTWILTVIMLFAAPDVELPPLPILNTGPLMTLIGGMLGLGGLRTYEKRLGIARTGIKSNN